MMTIASLAANVENRYYAGRLGAGFATGKYVAVNPGLYIKA